MQMKLKRLLVFIFIFWHRSPFMQPFQQVTEDLQVCLSSLCATVFILYIIDW